MPIFKSLGKIKTSGSSAKDEPQPQADNVYSDLVETVNFKAVAKYVYLAQARDEMSLIKGEVISVLKKSSDGWWQGDCKGKTGWFPSNYVDIITEEDYYGPSSPPRNQENREDFASSLKNKFGGKYPQGVSTTLKSTKPKSSKKPAPMKRPTEPPPLPPPNAQSRVVALSAFQSRHTAELTVSEGEELAVIDKVSDVNWWKVQNMNLKIGLVPSRYLGPMIQTTKASKSEKRSDDDQYRERAWFHGLITRDRAEEILVESTNNKEGDFLVRKSETTSGDYAVSVKAFPRCKHFRVRSTPRGSYLMGSREFSTLDEILDHYHNTPIFWDKVTAAKLYLRDPVRI